jgi:hypothetical protein
MIIAKCMETSLFTTIYVNYRYIIRFFIIRYYLTLEQFIDMMKCKSCDHRIYPVRFEIKEATDTA